MVVTDSYDILYVDMGYTKETIRGVSWLGGLRLFTRILSFLRTLIIARILSPSEFGVYGIATIALSLIEILTETGINIFLIQKKENIDKYINTAWIVSIIRGFFISLIILISSRFVSDFFETSEVLPLLMLISVVPFIRGFINPSVVKFQKELNFNKEFSYRSSIFLVDSLTAILLVVIVRSPIALVYGLIFGAVYEVLISFLVTPRPNLSYNIEILKEIISKGKWIASSGILAFLFQNGDNIIVGRMLGTGNLGIYEMGYRISMLPVKEISDIAARVTFPVYVKISEDKARLRRAFIKTSVITALLVTPILLLFLLYPYELINLFLGSKWLEAENILRIIALSAFLNMLSSPIGSVFFAVGKQKYLTILTGISLIIMVISIIPLISIFGLVGAAIAVAIGSLASTPLQIYLLIRVLSGSKLLK